MKQVRVSQDNAAPKNLVAYVGWLRPISWQLFCTFTFAWPVSDQQALKVFKEFVNRLERYVRGPIAFVRGDEKRFSGCGMPGAPRHFHVLLAAHTRLDRHSVANLWMEMAGRGKNGAGADVRIYDPTLGGLAYVLKLINQPDGDWDLRNLDLFLPQTPLDLNRRKRRRLARHARRASQDYQTTQEASMENTKGRDAATTETIK